MIQTHTPLFQYAVVGVVTSLLGIPLLFSILSARASRRRAQQSLYGLYDVPGLRLGCSFWLVVFLLVLLGVGLLLLALAHQGPFSLGPGPLTQLAQAAVPDLLTQAPTISAAHIDQVLRAAHSPAQGIGSQLVRLGRQYHLDPIFALAFFHHESNYGSRGVAVVTHSLGNIRCTPGVTCFQGYRSYQSWAQGAQDWYRLIHDVYLEHGLTTVKAIVPIYAPAADGNNVAGYITAVMRDVTIWRAEQTITAAKAVS